MSDLKTTQEAAATVLDGTELVRAVQTGGNVKATITQVQDFIIRNDPPTSDSAPGMPSKLAYDSFGNLFLCYAANKWAKFTGSTSFTETTSALLLRNGVDHFLLRVGADKLLLGH